MIKSRLTVSLIPIIILWLLSCPPGLGAWIAEVRDRYPDAGAVFHFQAQFPGFLSDGRLWIRPLPQGNHHAGQWLLQFLFDNPPPESHFKNWISGPPLDLPFGRGDKDGGGVTAQPGALSIPITQKIAGHQGILYWVSRDLRNPRNDSGTLFFLYNGDIMEGGIQTILDDLPASAFRFSLRNCCRMAPCFFPGFENPPLARNNILASAPLLNLVTFVMARKVRHSGTDETIAILKDILERDVLLSARGRQLGKFGAPVKPWHLAAGSDDRVYLSYGPGITYADADAPFFIFDPGILNLRDMEFLDRDFFFFKGRLFNRDPLSEAWFSSYEESPPAINRAIHYQVKKFQREGNLGSQFGRLKYFNKLNEFFIGEPLFADWKFSSALYEPFNNEVHVFHQASLSPFASALVVPNADTRSRLIAAMKTSRPSFHGIPWEEFIIDGFADFAERDREFGEASWSRLSYLMFLAAEVKSPYYIALKRAKEDREAVTLKNIAGEMEKMGFLKSALSNPQLLHSRQRRTLLKKGSNPSLEPSWLTLNSFPEGATIEAEKLLPPNEMALTEILKTEETKAVELELISRGTTGWRITLASGTDSIKYLAFSPHPVPTLRIQKNFLARLHAALSSGGIWHLLAQERLQSSLKGGELYPAVIRLLHSLDRKPMFLEIAELLQLSETRKQAIREMLRQ